MTHPVPDRVVWWTAFLGLGLLGAAFAVGIPLGGQPDEPAHVLKAAAMYDGELTWSERKEPIVGQPGQLTGTEIAVDAPLAYTRLVDLAICISQPPRRDATCQPELPGATETTRTNLATYVIAYPPVPYLLMGWPTALFEPPTAIRLVRVVNAVVCAALVASALVAARSARDHGWAVLGVALATTPTAVLFFTSPNPNGLEIAAAIAVAASFLAVLGGSGPPSVRTVTRLVVASSLLALSRPVSLAVLAFVAGFAVLGAATRPRVGELLREVRVRVGLAVIAVSTIAALAWFLYARPLEVLVGIADPTLGRREATRESLSRLLVRLREAIGVFGWGEVPAPTWMWAGWVALVVALLVVALVVGRARHRLVLLALVAVNAAIPTVMEVPRAADLGLIWQGRYSLPFAVLIPVYAGWVVGRSGRVRVDATRVAVASVAGFVGVAQVAGHGISMTRFATGTINPWWGYLDDPAWTPPVAPIVVAALAAAGALLWAAAVIAAPDEPRSAAAEEPAAEQPVEPQPAAEPLDEPLRP
jgi:hypothetical protein